MKDPRLVGMVCLLVTSICAAWVVSGQKAEEALMRAKSRHAHALLDAIIQEDFDVIREQAFRLKAIAETADWNVTEEPGYVRLSDAFIEATNGMMDAARDRKGDAAALAYVDLTLKCVQCHRYLRTRLPE